MKNNVFLKDLRNKAGLTQAEVAAALEIHPTAYAKLERGEMPIPKPRIGQLSETLGISRMALIELITKAFHDELVRSAFVDKRKKPRK